MPPDPPATTRSRRRVHPALLVVLLLTVAWAGHDVWRRSQRQARIVAYVTCPFRGEPVVYMRGDIPPWDTMPTRWHEDVHASQCRQLGPLKYRLRGLTAAGKLSLEAPAYCASAVARLRQDPDSQYASDRLHTDMIEGTSDVADSASVKRALMRHCPEIASQPRRTRGGFRRVRP